MQILHGTWIPESGADFILSGEFYLWVETIAETAFREVEPCHPRHLVAADLVDLLANEFKIQSPDRYPLEELITPCYFLLPTVDNQPLPSLELSRYLEIDLPDRFKFEYWQIDCCSIPAAAAVKSKAGPNSVIPLLNELHFLALHNLSEIQLGADLLFWFHFTQALKRIIWKDHYVPALKYRSLDPIKKRQSSKRSDNFEIYSGWEFIGEDYETTLEEFVEHMPLMCAAGFAEPFTTPQFYDRLSLLRHFSECLLTEIVAHTQFTKAFENTIKDSVLTDCLDLDVWPQAEGLEQYQQWQAWRDRIVRTQTDQPFYLYFHLQDPFNPDDPWQLQFQVAPKDDPSLKLALDNYWRMGPKQQKQVKDQLGGEFEQNLLLNLGYAARIYPDLWQGMETDQPVGIQLTLDGAFNFLKESAWVLENAGYKVIVPAWWTPKGRQRAKVRLKAKGKSLSGGDDKSKSYFSFASLVEYQYELAIGEEKITEQEWNQLVNAKTPLVQFRGQWMELDQDKMQHLLEFWKTHQQENPELSLLDFMKLTAAGEDDLEVECDRKDTLADMLTKLGDKNKLQPVDNPDTFQGQLREYQKRGVSWLQYLEQLGLNGCLADDMGLGKTVQVIARMVQERQPPKPKKGRKKKTIEAIQVPPTLLIAPTSVVGNWLREIQKFAPQIKAAVHHGSDRAKDAKTFKKACREHDILITSFALARKDAKLFNGVEWHRIVLDEAQNIKNPKAALTKAICKFSAPHRLALTGTPIENRLLDLWSIFNFLNPGYLGTQAQFRKSFEVPIQKSNNPRQSATLKKLVEPFILRRVKTDQSIIKDLPDKVEQKLFCNLTKEQASLYEAVVKDVETQLQAAEGIHRKGLILATLTKLKQVCNHPRQFLQDDSEFTAVRSHKLTRLTEMVEEAMEERDSLLVFTQFTELGSALEKYLRHTFHCNTYYLHGGTSRKKREAMIAEFQDPETEPSVFVLSLKAGGVGITLTKANHVFHFDRWWNPSVEDQATDRAFRIGQKKNVFVHKFVAMGTLEERIDEMIEDKKKLAGSIVGADESWLTELDNDAFRQLISLNKSAIME
ncbi:DEAD/DEAH box helicase [Leptolyngbyaceae cyanobacterium CCMR0082]|uniref:DEAD/DEAH box helicase n=1 Tax=Adonisia turfae CCMR0082 TaxID=2304604 RepID=A0A6M0SDL3_9CYAN|nr:DEAD/DEAH box helicase [Adonisia turfae]NEZ66426.1 DEAD/DEAH box helicase [Adonisia turfae CCMR0082]